MGTADAAAGLDKYDVIEKIALNLEQAFMIADAARPPRQFVVRPPISGTFSRTPRTSAASESNWRSPTPNRPATPSLNRAPDHISYLPDPIPYRLSEAEYLRLREAKACFY